MNRSCSRFQVLIFLLGLSALVGSAAGPPDTAALLSAQRQSMQPLAIFDGTWRGPSKVTLPDGKEVQNTQTERVGSFLDGSIKVIEGRGYAADGSMSFNAFGVISYSPQTEKYNLHSYAQGHSGDFPMEVRVDGFTWSIKAGPATIRYTATVKDGIWTEVGDRILEGQPAVRIFEMNLRRVANTDWPGAGAVPVK